MANKQGKRRGRVKDIPYAQELPGEAQDREAAFVQRTKLYPGPDDRDRLVLRIGRTEHWEMVDWFVGQQTKLPEGWVDVVTYDCSHGSEPHRHQYRRTKKGSRRGRQDRVNRTGDLADILREVVDELLDGEWAANRRRFLG